MNAKKVFCFIMAGILALSSCACQKAPSEKTVSSKSSGTTNYTSSATASGTGDIGEAVRVKNEEQFFSTYDSVEFTFNIDKAVPVSAMPEGFARLFVGRRCKKGSKRAVRRS